MLNNPSGDEVGFADCDYIITGAYDVACWMQLDYIRRIIICRLVVHGPSTSFDSSN